MNRADQIDCLQLLEEQSRKNSRNKIALFYPDEGPLRRELAVPAKGNFYDVYKTYLS